MVGEWLATVFSRGGRGSGGDSKIAEVPSSPIHASTPRRRARLLWVAVGGAVAVAVSVVAGLDHSSATAGSSYASGPTPAQLNAQAVYSGTGGQSAGLAVHVSANHLVDQSGRQVVLRGADLSGTEFACIQGGSPTNRGWSIYGGQPLDQPSTYSAMAAWGIDVVRVPLNEDCWLGINGVASGLGGYAYQKAVEQEVSLIGNAGMVAILDLHWSSPGPYAAYWQQPMADAQHSIPFWHSVASAFKSDPAVMFDLYNEPFFYYISDGSNQWDCWLNGCQMNQFISYNQVGPDGKHTGYTTSYSWRTAGMQQMIAAVRDAGATQPLIVNGVDWANDESGWLAHAPTDPAGQLVAGWHSYPGQGCSPMACWNGVVAPLATHYPVVVGETGDSSAGPQAYLPSFLPWADAHGVSYLAWTWNPWQDGSNVLIKGWDGAPTAGEGTYFRGHLSALAGAGLAAPRAPTAPPDTTTVPPDTTTVPPAGGATTPPTAPTRPDAPTTAADPVTTGVSPATTPPETTSRLHAPDLTGPGSAPAPVALRAWARAPRGYGPSDGISVTLPTAVTSGDVLVAQVDDNGRAGQAIRSPPGWSLVPGMSNPVSPTPTLSAWWYYRVASTADAGARTSWSWSGGRRWGSVIVADYQNVDQTEPFDAAASNAGAGRSPVNVGVTTTSGGDETTAWAVSVGGPSLVSGNLVPEINERTQQDAGEWDGATANTGTGPYTWTLSSAHSWADAVIALRRA